MKATETNMQFIQSLDELHTAMCKVYERWIDAENTDESDDNDVINAASENYPFGGVEYSDVIANVSKWISGIKSHMPTPDKKQTQ